MSDAVTFAQLPRPRRSRRLGAEVGGRIGWNGSGSTRAHSHLHSHSHAHTHPLSRTHTVYTCKYRYTHTTHRRTHCQTANILLSSSLLLLFSSSPLLLLPLLHSLTLSYPLSPSLSFSLLLSPSLSPSLSFSLLSLLSPPPLLLSSLLSSLFSVLSPLLLSPPSPTHTPLPPPRRVQTQCEWLRTLSVVFFGDPPQLKRIVLRLTHFQSRPFGKESDWTDKSWIRGSDGTLAICYWKQTPLGSITSTSHQLGLLPSTLHAAPTHATSMVSLNWVFHRPP